MTSEKDLSDSFKDKEVPPFLEILGFKGAKLLDDESFVCDFSPSVDLTHSNGMIVQGGFVTGMLDACMAQFIIYKHEGQKIPLTLRYRC